MDNTTNLRSRQYVQSLPSKMSLAHLSNAFDDQLQAAPMHTQNEPDTLAFKPKNLDCGQEMPLSPRSFILFPKLPMELRLKIWRFTFPDPKEVQIGLPNLKPRLHPGNEKRDVLIVPIAMCIHSESRNETLKFYCVANEFPQRPEWIHNPICFSPTRDIVCLQYFNMFPYNDFQPSAWTIQHHLWALSEQAPSHMNNVSHLHITGVYDTDSYSASKLFSADIIEDNEEHPGLEDYSSALFHFPALQKVILDVPGDPASHERDVDDTVKEFRTFLELHKDKFHGGRAPEVVALLRPAEALKFEDESLYLRLEEERVRRLNAERDS